MRRAHWRSYALLLLALAVVIVGIWLTYTFFTTRFPGGNDFLPRWLGGRALLLEGLSPYSDQVTERVQLMLHGRLAEGPLEDRGAFAYPLYCLALIWPLCLVGDFALARALWMWVLLGGLAASAVLAMKVVKWRPRLGLWALSMAWVLLLYHDFRAVLLGQFAILVGLALVAALWALQRGYDGWAGVLLALTTIKPQMVYLAIPWLLVWTAGQKRWRLWWGFGLAMGALSLGSLVLVPTWPLDVARQVMAYSSYTVYGSMTYMFTGYLLGLGATVEIVATGLLVLGALALAWRLWRGSWEQMVWMLGLLLLLTNFFTPRIATTNYLLLVPWVLWAFQWMQRAWGRRGTWAVIVLEVVSLVGLWALFLTTIEGNFETAPVYFPVPVFVLVLLAWLWRKLDWKDRVDV